MLDFYLSAVTQKVYPSFSGPQEVPPTYYGQKFSIHDFHTEGTLDTALQGLLGPIGVKFIKVTILGKIE